MTEEQFFALLRYIDAAIEAKLPTADLRESIRRREARADLAVSFGLSPEL